MSPTDVLRDRQRGLHSEAKRHGRGRKSGNARGSGKLAGLQEFGKANARYAKAAKGLPPRLGLFSEPSGFVGIAHMSGTAKLVGTSVVKLSGSSVISTPLAPSKRGVPKTERSQRLDGGATVSGRDALLYRAADALRASSLSPASVESGRAAALLLTAVHDIAERRPRHAAVALAAWDCLTCNANPLASKAARMVLWEASRVLISQFISTDDEMRLLDAMQTAGLSRVPVFDEGPLASYPSTA
jgi:hypothetical protein